MHVESETTLPQASLFPLTQAHIGIWTSRRSRKLLLSLPSKKLFVVLAVRKQLGKSEDGQGHLGRIEKALQLASHMLDARNPFAAPVELGGGPLARVVAIEVPWDDIVGIDYARPLHQDGRLVLEAHTLTKRTFRSLLDAQHYYSWTPEGVRGIGGCGANSFTSNNSAVPVSDESNFRFSGSGCCSPPGLTFLSQSQHQLSRSSSPVHRGVFGGSSQAPGSQPLPLPLHALQHGHASSCNTSPRSRTPLPLQRQVQQHQQNQLNAHNAHHLPSPLASCTPPYSRAIPRSSSQPDLHSLSHTQPPHPSASTSPPRPHSPLLPSQTMGGVLSPAGSLWPTLGSQLCTPTPSPSVSGRLLGCKHQPMGGSSPIDCGQLFPSQPGTPTLSPTTPRNPIGYECQLQSQPNTPAHSPIASSPIGRAAEGSGKRVCGGDVAAGHIDSCTLAGEGRRRSSSGSSSSSSSSKGGTGETCRKTLRWAGEQVGLLERGTSGPCQRAPDAAAKAAAATTQATEAAQTGSARGAGAGGVTRNRSYTKAPSLRKLLRASSWVPSSSLSSSSSPPPAAAAAAPAAALAAAPADAAAAASIPFVCDAGGAWLRSPLCHHPSDSQSIPCSSSSRCSDPTFNHCPSGLCSPANNSSPLRTLSSCLACEREQCGNNTPLELAGHSPWGHHVPSSTSSAFPHPHQHLEDLMPSPSPPYAPTHAAQHPMHKSMSCTSLTPSPMLGANSSPPPSAAPLSTLGLRQDMHFLPRSLDHLASPSLPAATLFRTPSSVSLCPLSTPSPFNTNSHSPFLHTTPDLTPLSTAFPLCKPRSNHSTSPDGTPLSFASSPWVSPLEACTSPQEPAPTPTSPSAHFPTDAALSNSHSSPNLCSAGACAPTHPRPTCSHQGVNTAAGLRGRWVGSANRFQGNSDTGEAVLRTTSPLSRTTSCADLQYWSDGGGSSVRGRGARGETISRNGSKRGTQSARVDAKRDPMSQPGPEFGHRCHSQPNFGQWRSSQPFVSARAAMEGREQREGGNRGAAEGLLSRSLNMDAVAQGSDCVFDMYHAAGQVGERWTWGGGPSLGAGPSQGADLQAPCMDPSMIWRGGQEGEKDDTTRAVGPLVIDDRVGRKGVSGRRQTWGGPVKQGVPQCLGPPVGLDGIPAASRWTAASCSYTSRTLVLHFTDPHLPGMLSQFVKSDVRLLKLYESGLPAWAVFLPSYGLWYRPWMRKLTWFLFMAVSVMSMAMGFYDLYKHVPIVRQAMAAFTARLFPQAQALFEWLERHAQIRLSILLTYLFSKSPLLMGLVRLLRNVMSVITQLLSPFLAWLSASALPPLRALATSLAHLCSPITSGVTLLATHVYALLAHLLGPLLQAVSSVGDAMWAVGVGLAQLVQALLSGPLHVMQQLWLGLMGPLLLLRQLGSALLTGLSGPLLLLRTCGQLLGEGGWVMCQHLYGGMQGLVGGLCAAWGMLGTQLQLLASFLVALARAAAPWSKMLSNARPVAESMQQAGPGATHAGGALHASRSLVWWAGQEAWTVAQLVRVTLYQCVKSMQAVINCIVAVCLAVNRHRVSLLLQLRRALQSRSHMLPGMAARCLMERQVSRGHHPLVSVLPPDQLAAAAAAGVLDEDEHVMLIRKSQESGHRHTCHSNSFDSADGPAQYHTEIGAEFYASNEAQHHAEGAYTLHYARSEAGGAIGEGSHQMEQQHLHPHPSRYHASSHLQHPMHHQHHQSYRTWLDESHAAKDEDDREQQQQQQQHSWEYPCKPQHLLPQQPQQMHDYEFPTGAPSSNAQHQYHQQQQHEYNLDHWIHHHHEQHQWLLPPQQQLSKVSGSAPLLHRHQYQHDHKEHNNQQQHQQHHQHQQPQQRQQQEALHPSEKGVHTGPASEVQQQHHHHRHQDGQRQQQQQQEGQQHGEGQQCMAGMPSNHRQQPKRRGRHKQQGKEGKAGVAQEGTGGSRSSSMGPGRALSRVLDVSRGIAQKAGRGASRFPSPSKGANAAHRHKTD